MEPQSLNHLLELNFAQFFENRKTIFDTVESVLNDYYNLLSAELIESLIAFKNEFFELFENKIQKLLKDIILFKVAIEQKSLNELQQTEEVASLVSLQKQIVEQSNSLVETTNSKIINSLNLIDIDNENFTNLVQNYIKSFENLINDTFDLILKINKIE